MALPDQKDQRFVVVGAGPAGLRAVEQLVMAGLRPVLVDEACEPGGQIYRRPPPALAALRDSASLYGADAGRADDLRRMFQQLRERIDYRPSTLVWNATREQGDAIRLHLRGPDGDSAIDASAVVLSTGAMDRVLPLPGWTLPGVFSLGGSQVMLKAQAHAIGSRPVFAGSGPLLYLVAWQYAKAGVKPAAVIDSATFRDKMRALPWMLSRPATLLRGVKMLSFLRLIGVPVIQGARAQRIEALEQGLRVSWGGDERGGTIDCDAVAIGDGLKPERQLADLLGCSVRFNPSAGQWLADVTEDGRASFRGVYLAGDMVAINGAHAAEAAGELAASALLADFGISGSTARRRRLRFTLSMHARFRHGVETAFPLPREAARSLDDGTIVCRCEGVTAGDLRRAITDWSLTDVNRLKAMTRCGMGRCQGRLCGGTAAAVLAAETSVSLADVGTLRGQAPVKPRLPVPAAGGI